MQPFNGSKEELGKLIERKQKSLVPLNIAVIVICLVAAISLLFAPLISVDLSRLSEATAAMQQEGDGADGAESEMQQSMLDGVGKAFGKISVNVFTLAGFATKPDLATAIGDYAGELLSSAGDALITEMALPMMIEQMESQGNDIPEIKNAQAILDKFKALEGADEADVDEKINALAAEVQTQLGKEFLPDESIADFNSSVRSLYDVTTENNDGNFSIEACICVTASQALAEGDGNYTVYTDYDALAGALTDKMLSSEGSSDAEEIFGVISTVLKAAAFAMLFFVLVWVILLVFALVHIFMPNKRFMMWYVKLFGAYPCIIFFLAPLIAKAVIPGIAGEAAGSALAMMGLISSMTWISGICYLLLWAISIFWAFPIKRKIRYYKKQYDQMV